MSDKLTESEARAALAGADMVRMWWRRGDSPRAIRKHIRDMSMDTREHLEFFKKACSRDAVLIKAIEKCILEKENLLAVFKRKKWTHPVGIREEE